MTTTTTPSSTLVPRTSASSALLNPAMLSHPPAPGTPSRPVSSSSTALPSAVPTALPACPRTNTFLEDDAVMPKMLPQIKLADFKEQKLQGLAASALGSSKHHRANYKGWPNEDKIFLSSTSWFEGETTVRALFAAVFDGHGGEGLASDFCAQQLFGNFEEQMALAPVAESLNGRVLGALERAFIKTDHDLYLLIKSEAAKTKIQGRCRCKFFLEVPCACLNAPIPANEGSTGTVLVITQNDVFCANIGDSDALLFPHRSFPQARADSPRSKRLKTCADPSPPPRALTVTDTPLVDEANEDYRRIRAVAKQRRKQVKVYDAPADGILVSELASRFNYVSLPGARSLNMTRAFGNLGHKVMSSIGLVEAESSIISRPHLAHVPRADVHGFIVAGSDGLWDNLDVDEVRSLVEKAIRVHPLEGDRVLQVAKDLLHRAVQNKRKPDDISVIVIPLLPGVVPGDVPTSAV